MICTTIQGNALGLGANQARTILSSTIVQGGTAQSVSVSIFQGTFTMW